MITSVFISLSLCSNIFSLFQCYVTSELFVSAIYSIPPASFPWHCQEDINLTENKKPSYCLSFTIIYILIINPQILLRAPCHKHYKWFWVLWKLLLVSYCIVVWVLCGVFLCFCITSFGDCTCPLHQETAKNHQGRVGTEEKTFRWSLLFMKANHKELFISAYCNFANI